MSAMQSKGSGESGEQRLGLGIFGHSHVGKSRRFNDDNYLCLELPGEETRRVLMSVADGLGGHAGGYIASHVAIESLREESVHYSVLQPGEGPSIQAVLKAAYRKANSEILRRAGTEEGLQGMGTTLVSALVVENHATFANVGDSRAYLVRRGECVPLTEDHSWRVEQRKRGTPEEEIRESPFWGTITRCVGFDESLEVDLVELTLEFGDGILLCSDGLWESLEPQDVAGVFQNTSDAETACRQLVDMANERDGSDNITGIVLRSLLTTGPASRKTKLSDTVPLDFSALRETSREPGS